MPGVSQVGTIATEQLTGDRNTSQLAEIRGEGTENRHAEGVPEPDDGGMISGPCGGLFSTAVGDAADATGLLVDTDPRFPDPQGSHALIKSGNNPLSGIVVQTQRGWSRRQRGLEHRTDPA